MMNKSRIILYLQIQKRKNHNKLKENMENLQAEVFEELFPTQISYKFNFIFA
ncbi:hypothetical protein B0I22_1061 [Epilithonimonas xixisoli]|uniref:Uncharacterized protein n=1 Tax=Epilithonimonas xixisoli TaxID=1476462 RepID=A0A4R8IBF3_9FLAO|nr:hypothetical protein B0I22_1061 [Epilithonimonas xixisoli]